MVILTRVSPDKVSIELSDPVDKQALAQAKDIVDKVKECSVVGPGPLLEVARNFGEIKGSQGYLVPLSECKSAFDSLKPVDRQCLLNIRDRVKAFAVAQRKSITDMTMAIPGGRAGHTVSPCATAGCYAPGGRYPLPSSVVMTVVTARAAGCKRVVVASPNPANITLAAAYAAGADQVLRVGGAQAIAAMAFGVKSQDGAPGTFEVPPCDMIVGPGNKWVTAAKSIVQGRCGIDMLAGPSEVLVICDASAKPEVVAADLIAQAEHDVVARPIVLSDDKGMLDRIDAAVIKQLQSLPEPNQATARAAFTNGFAVHCQSIAECIRISDIIAPEHLEIHTKDAMKVGMDCSNYGGLFVGEHAAEVMGDYGAGPNHTLPTGGTGRYTGGLSVFNFLRVRTWMRLDEKKASQAMVEDAVRMARLEGLEGHARAAEFRLTSKL